MSQALGSSAPTVLGERHGPVLVLTLNRPERLNAWTDEMEARYFEALATAQDDPDVRAIVVTGAGRGFCAGADMDDLAKLDGSPDVDLPQSWAATRSYPLSIGKPMIAAINGAAAGLGLVEALYCDVRFSTSAAKFTSAFSRRGLIAEYGLAWLLPRVVGVAHAADLLLSGRVITGEEALGIGLVNRVVEPASLLTEAVAYAHDIATHCSPTSIAIIKRQLVEAASSDFVTAFATADERMHDSFRRADAAEGVASYLERRPPQFPGLTVDAVP